jgi:hypothetical protein
MAGDERVRFCGHCQRHVYNLSGMTRAEAEAVIHRKEGRPCVRFYRRPDGTILTRDCQAFAGLRRWVLAGGGLALSLILALYAFFLACPVATDEPSRVRDVEPVRTILEWIDPVPTLAPVTAPPGRSGTYVTMGKICVPEREGPDKE